MTRGFDAGRWIAQVRAFTMRYFRGMSRSRLGLVFLVAWPTMWYVLMAHLLFRPAGDDRSVLAAAKATYAIGFGLFGALTVTLNGFVGSFVADIRSKRYRKFRSMAVSPGADLIGRFLAGFALSAVAYGGLLVVGYLDGAAFALRSPLSIPVVLASLFAFSVIGVVAALVVSVLAPRPEYATTVATILLLVVLFLTGFNGANAAVFPGPKPLLNYLPPTLATRIQIYHLVDAPFGAHRPFTPPAMPGGGGFLALLIAYAAGATFVGGWIMAALVYRGELGE